MLSKDVLDILACPTCKGSLRYDAGSQKLGCCSCSLLFPVRDSIPVLLIDAAEAMPEPAPIRMVNPHA